MTATIQAFESYVRHLQSFFWAEGFLALVAALFAIALRRQRRLFKSPGFIMLSLGLIIDMMVPQVPLAQLPQYSQILIRVGHAAALALVIFGIIRLAVEAFLVIRFQRRADPSTFAAEAVLVASYAITALAIMRFMLGLDPRILFAVPALGTLIVGWVRQANFFGGLLIQYHRPFVSGDWVKMGNFQGRVVGTGWRATWIVTRANEQVQIPNTVLASQPVVNYSAGGVAVADEIYLDTDNQVSPAHVEQTVSRVLADIPEVMHNEIDVAEYRYASIRYRIRFWVGDYAGQERIRARVTRTLWYALRRESIELASPAELTIPELNGRVEGPRREPLDGHKPQTTVGELRRVYLLNALSDEELGFLVQTARPRQFGRGEVLMHEGDEADSFYILRKGRVEIVAREKGAAVEMHIRDIDASSPENFFGEIALLTGAKRNATVRAVTDVDVLELGRDGFSKLFRAKPSAGASLAEVASRRSHETTSVTAPVVLPESGEAERRSAMILLTMRRIFDF